MEKALEIDVMILQRLEQVMAGAQAADEEDLARKVKADWTAVQQRYERNLERQREEEHLRNECSKDAELMALRQQLKEIRDLEEQQASGSARPSGGISPPVLVPGVSVLHKARAPVENFPTDSGKEPAVEKDRSEAVRNQVTADGAPSPTTLTHGNSMLHKAPVTVDVSQPKSGGEPTTEHEYVQFVAVDELKQSTPGAVHFEKSSERQRLRKQQGWDESEPLFRWDDTAPIDREWLDDESGKEKVTLGMFTPTTESSDDLKQASDIPSWMRVGGVAYLPKWTTSVRIVSIPDAAQRKTNPHWRIGVVPGHFDSRDPIDLSQCRTIRIKLIAHQDCVKMPTFRNSLERQRRLRSNEELKPTGFNMGDRVLYEEVPARVTGITGQDTVIVTDEGDQLCVEEIQLQEILESPVQGSMERIPAWCRNGTVVEYIGSLSKGKATILHVMMPRKEEEDVRVTIAMERTNGSTNAKQDVRNTTPNNLVQYVNPTIQRNAPSDCELPSPPDHKETPVSQPLKLAQPGMKCFSERHQMFTAIEEVHIDPATGSKFALIMRTWMWIAGEKSIEVAGMNPNAMKVWVSELATCRSTAALAQLEQDAKVKEAKMKEAKGSKKTGTDTVTESETSSTHLNCGAWAEHGNKRAATSDTENSAKRPNNDTSRPEGLRNGTLVELKNSICKCIDCLVTIVGAQFVDLGSGTTGWMITVKGSSHSEGGYRSPEFTMTCAEQQIVRRAEIRMEPQASSTTKLFHQPNVEPIRPQLELIHSEKEGELQRSERHHWLGTADGVAAQARWVEELQNEARESNYDELEQEQREMMQDGEVRGLERSGQVARTMQDQKLVEMDKRIELEVELRVQNIERQKMAEAWLKEGEEVFSIQDSKVVTVKTVQRETDLKKHHHNCYVQVPGSGEHVSYRHSSMLIQTPGKDGNQNGWAMEPEPISEEREEELQRIMEESRQRKAPTLDDFLDQKHKQEAQEKLEQEACRMAHEIRRADRRYTDQDSDNASWENGEGRSERKTVDYAARYVQRTSEAVLLGNNRTQQLEHSDEATHSTLDIEKQFRNAPTPPEAEQSECSSSSMMFQRTSNDTSGRGGWSRAERKSPESDLAATAGGDKVMKALGTMNTAASPFRHDETDLWVPDETPTNQQKYNASRTEAATLTIDVARKFDPASSEATTFRADFYLEAAFKLLPGTPTELVVEQILRNLASSDIRKELIGEGCQQWSPEQVFHWLEVKANEVQDKVATPNERVKEYLEYKPRQSDSYPNFTKKMINDGLNLLDTPVRANSLEEAKRMFEVTGDSSRFETFLHIIQHLAFTKMPNTFRLLAVVMKDGLQVRDNIIEMRATFAADTCDGEVPTTGSTHLQAVRAASGDRNG